MSEDKIKINCKVKGGCKNCEMMEYNWPIVFIKPGFYEKRETLVGFKCKRYGHCAETIKQLQKEGYLDDIIFIE